MASFVILLILGGVLTIASFFAPKKIKSVGIFFGFVGLFICVFFAFQTKYGEIVWEEQISGVKGAHWLVADQSCGEITRHWILVNAYVSSERNSDGWKFTEYTGNSIYVSGECIIVRIDEPVRQFMNDYKKRYRIPVDQEPIATERLDQVDWFMNENAY